MVVEVWPQGKPVIHFELSSEEPSNSSSNINFQLPGTPFGIGFDDGGGVVGTEVGVGAVVGFFVGVAVGLDVGCEVGFDPGFLVGAVVGCAVGVVPGSWVGTVVGFGSAGCVGFSAGEEIAGAIINGI